MTTQLFFQKIRWKNLFTYGSAWTEIELNSHHRTLIIGENGIGKSVILDALCLATFNKPFRNVNKPDVVNDRNKKDCLIELEFTAHNKQYKVVRGLAPNILEICENGVLLKQEGSSSDYQEILEKNILGFSYKTFIQTIVLGSATYKSFMDLSPADRRVVIEDILDIGIFSTMNKVAKEFLTEINQKIPLLNKDRDMVKQAISLLESQIKKTEDNRKIGFEKIDVDLEEKKTILIELNKEFAIEDNKFNELKSIELQDVSVIQSKKEEILGVISNLDSKLKQYQREIEFYKNNDSCPTCKQAIDLMFKEESLQEKLEKVNKVIPENKKILYEKVSKINQKITDAQVYNENIKKQRSDVKNKISIIDSKRNTIAQDMYKLEQEKKKFIESSDKDLSSEMTQLNEQNDKLKHIDYELSSLNHDKMYYEATLTLLKDSGIKTMIILNYLPHLNASVNKYLKMMDLFVEFEFDETFNEAIKARYRNSSKYEAFSQGQKQRINMAILFSLRELSEMKNTINTNLFVLDEIFDSALDSSGEEDLLQILKSFGDKLNIFVISPKDILVDHFDRCFAAKLVDDYCVLA